MVLRFVLVLLFFNCVRTAETSYDHDQVKDVYSSSIIGQPIRPSMHKAMKSIRKRDEHSSPITETEGGPIQEKKSSIPPVESKPVAATVKSPLVSEKQDVSLHNSTVTGNISKLSNETIIQGPKVIKENATNHNITSKVSPSELALNNPGVLKRGLIVFGGFGLMAVAYYVFFKRKSNKNNINNTHSNNDANQFRYGVLQSDEQRDNLELSRIPLTMDSDEDDDEDLEIFDLEQKKKSLSYVNSQPNDDDFDVSSSNFTEIRPGQDGDSLLLDIDTNDTLINWSNNLSDNKFNSN